ncbi:MAG: MBL fold metallo-hydrolase [Armatimonadia bacterium]
MDRRELLPGLWLFKGACNVYLVCDGDHAIAIDFGGGEWLSALPELSLRHVDHVFITHAHREQCEGLAEWDRGDCLIHAPAGEERFLAPERAAEFGPPPWYGMGCPPNYEPPKRVPGVRYDMAGNGHLFWRGRRIRFMHTPGHGANACTVIVDHKGKQVVFCGDAAHEGATLWQPFHLETDHWTGTGALAAWEGVERLRNISIGLLCPSHGPVIEKGACAMLGRLSRKLMSFYHAKGQISPGEKDRYLPVEATDSGARRLSPHLYQFGGNGYLLLSDTGEGLVVDPTRGDLPALERLLAEVKVRPTAMTVSHYHYDHCDGIPELREKYGAKAYLHPLIAEALEPGRCLPWRLEMPIEGDELWPERGDWQWNEYAIKIAPWPGQTWWHCVWMTVVDGRKVLFAGDSFTPTSKWNGTGGFCAYNGSRFEGFVESAKLAIEWNPHVIAAGHVNQYHHFAPKFGKIIRWAKRAEDAVRALCPSGDLEQDYYSVNTVVSKLVE